MLLRGKVPSFLFSVQSEKTCWSKQQRVQNKYRESSKSHNYDALLLYYFSVLCCFFFSFHDRKSQQQRPARTKTRPERERTTSGRWNDIICAAAAIMCHRNKWSPPAEGAWWASLCRAGCWLVKHWFFSGCHMKVTSRVHPISCSVIPNFFFSARIKLSYHLTFLFE